MRKLIYYVAVTVDGFIAAPDGAFDFFPLEGDHGPWLTERYPETIPGHFRETFGLTQARPRAFDTVLMGRATHQVAVDEGLASGYPHLRQYVFTSHPGDLPVEDGLTITSGDPVAVVRELKAEPSDLDIWLCGGGALAATLIDEIDEFRLKVNPLILGAGIPLVAGQAAPVLSLRRRMAREFESGVTYMEFVRA